MKKSRFAVVFLISSMLLFLINLLIIVVFSNFEVKSTFYSALNVSSLVIAFVSFIASSFFSFTVYLQTKNQNKINESLPKKDDQYIIANYSLFNIETEISFFSIHGDEKEGVLQSHAYLGEAAAGENNVTRIVFLPTDSVNMPTYRVLVKSIEFMSTLDETIYAATASDGVNGAYSANILNRGYNCFTVDVLNGMDVVSEAFKKSSYIKLNLDIISVFNVKMTVSFFVHLDGAKSTANNPDKVTIPDLTTYTIHHSNYRIEEKSIVSV